MIPVVPLIWRVFKDNKTIGWEFDLVNTVKIYKNLTFDISGGVMSLGNAMRYSMHWATKNQRLHGSSAEI